ncbi:MAG: HAMP domain-containing sensor histidine kinase [Bacteroidetes bacterium]|nr:HAMP domain-containing sensor histidine kinase [Bacteroidota bacterium]MCY4205151.1 HAMP domain-containing sensor histidine kinase [Bacteroidota bacterium]
MTHLHINSLSHDIKTPLNAIALYNDLLRTMEFDDPERQICHEVIADQINHLVHITRSILEQNTRPEGHDQIDLISLLQDTASIYQKLHPEYTFLVNIDNLIPPVWGDGPALGRVLTNLLDNSIAYSQPTLIVIAAELQSGGIQIRIRDRGDGIQPNQLPYIFKPQFRGNLTVPGNGMGLAIAQEIVHAHGGYIEVASTVGVGTVIRIILPQSIFVELP